MSFWTVVDEEPPEEEPDEGDAADDVERRLPSGSHNQSSAHGKSEDESESCSKETSGNE